LLIEEIERLHVDLWNAKTTQEQDSRIRLMGTVMSKQAWIGRCGPD
jgi:hypothetical protein